MKGTAGVANSQSPSSLASALAGMRPNRWTAFSICPASRRTLCNLDTSSSKVPSAESTTKPRCLIRCVGSSVHFSSLTDNPQRCRRYRKRRVSSRDSHSDRAMSSQSSRYHRSLAPAPGLPERHPGDLRLLTTGSSNLQKWPGAKFHPNGMAT